MLNDIDIIMGSKSDMLIMQSAIDLFDKYSIEYKQYIVSAHRTPKWMYEYSELTEERKVKVIIAGAGGAAHLPGMVASLVHIPVIGVPISGKTLQGLDSLLSIVQMPRGIPVATVAIDNSTNAAILAIRILALYSEKLINVLKDISKENENITLS